MGDLQDAETGDLLPDPVMADACVLAVDTANARLLFPPAFGNGAAPADVHDGSGEWSMGCSFSLSTKDLPEYMRTPCAAPRMVMDSPWHITYCIVKRESFLGLSDQRPRSDVTIFATGSNLEDAPGRLFGKAAVMCNPKELKLEYLEQIGIAGDLAETLAEQGSTGLGSEYVSRADIAAMPWKYDVFALGPEQDDAGHRWAMRALLFIETKDAPDVGTIAPGCENLFLAGEYISSKYTTIKVPTMEKSAETGAMAAREAMRWL